MPHVIIEISRNVADRIDIGDLVARAHRGLCNTGLLPSAAIKTRAVVHDYFAAGAGETPLGFMTAIVRIQTGRPVESEKTIGNTVFEVLRGVAARLDGLGVSVSVDVQHIYRDASFSAVTGGRSDP